MTTLSYTTIHSKDNQNVTFYIEKPESDSLHKRVQDILDLLKKHDLMTNAGEVTIVKDRAPRTGYRFDVDYHQFERVAHELDVAVAQDARARDVDRNELCYVKSTVPSFPWTWPHTDGTVLCHVKNMQIFWAHELRHDEVRDKERDKDISRHGIPYRDLIVDGEASGFCGGDLICPSDAIDEFLSREEAEKLKDALDKDAPESTNEIVKVELPISLYTAALDKGIGVKPKYGEMVLGLRGFDDFPACGWVYVGDHPEWEAAVEEYQKAWRMTHVAIIDAEPGFFVAAYVPPDDLASDDLGRFTLTPIQEWEVRRGVVRWKDGVQDPPNTYWEPRAEGKRPAGVAIRMPDGKYHLGYDLVDGTSSQAVDERAALEKLKGARVRQKSFAAAPWSDEDDETAAFFKKLAAKAEP